MSDINIKLNKTIRAFVYISIDTISLGEAVMGSNISEIIKKAIEMVGMPKMHKYGNCQKIDITIYNINKINS